jgi:hypothetical protein
MTLCKRLTEDLSKLFADTFSDVSDDEECDTEIFDSDVITASSDK